MNETWTTLQGWAGTDPEVRETPYGAVASFRVACTPRYQREGEWHDGPTSWFTVNAWRTLGEHVAASVRKGDPVMVHGRMRLETWERDGVETTGAVVEAGCVGHDLNRGTAMFRRAVRPDRAEPVGSEAPEGADPAQEGVGAEQVA